MRLVTFTHDGRTRLGVVVGDEVADLGAGAHLPADMLALLASGPSGLDAVGRATDRAPRLPLATVHLEAPVPRPPTFLGIGLNYADHIRESGLPRPEFPVFFNKQTTCVTGPYDPIERPRVSKALDYEGELAFVIGRRCRHVPRDRAPEVIAGYLVCNDVSVRDWQFKAPTMTLGKSFDTHGPLGPCLVTPDEIGDPHDLALRTLVNGEQRQASNTRHLIFDCFAQVEVLSTVCTLEPGTVITTGTPDGVGAAMQPMRFLRPGDVVRVEIDGLGHIENPVIQEPEGPDAAGARDLRGGAT
jgi:2-keto-4-pentenoate hydratase/2-oxohepta-3-ene-1,7-dioic acid hydratase in catechol pathway